MHCTAQMVCFMCHCVCLSMIAHRYYSLVEEGEANSEVSLYDNITVAAAFEFSVIVNVFDTFYFEKFYDKFKFG